MELIRKSDARRNKKGHLVYYGLFQCPFCFSLVERSITQGNRDKSCGCARYKLVSISHSGQKRTEEQRINISKGLKGKKHTEERIKKTAESNKGKKRTLGQRQKQSESRKGKYILEKHPNWNNGSSLESYPFEFFLIRNQILERDINVCQTPGCVETGNLCIHHIDYNKLNNNPENLITLCQSHHSKTNGKNKRLYFTEFYQSIMMSKLMECLL